MQYRVPYPEQPKNRPWAQVATTLRRRPRQHCATQATPLPCSRLCQEKVTVFPLCLQLKKLKTSRIGYSKIPVGLNRDESPSVASPAGNWAHFPSAFSLPRRLSRHRAPRGHHRPASPARPHHRALPLPSYLQIKAIARAPASTFTSKACTTLR